MEKEAEAGSLKGCMSVMALETLLAKESRGGTGQDHRLTQASRHLAPP